MSRIRLRLAILPKNWEYSEILLFFCILSVFSLSIQNRPETFGQTDILYREGSRKQRRYLGRGKAGNAATDLGYQKGHFGMAPGKTDKIIHIRADALYASLHGGDCIGAALKPYALPPHGAPLVERQTGCSAAMKPLQVTAKKQISGRDATR